MIERVRIERRLFPDMDPYRRDRRRKPHARARREGDETVDPSRRTS